MLARSQAAAPAARHHARANSVAHLEIALDRSAVLDESQFFGCGNDDFAARHTARWGAGRRGRGWGRRRHRGRGRWGRGRGAWRKLWRRRWTCQSTKFTKFSDTCHSNRHNHIPEAIRRGQREGDAVEGRAGQHKIARHGSESREVKGKELRDAVHVNRIAMIRRASGLKLAKADGSHGVVPGYLLSMRVQGPGEAADHARCGAGRGGPVLGHI